MGVLKNNVGRPTNKTIMIRRIFKVVLCILLFVVCYFAGYKFGSSIDTDEKKQEVSNKKEENVKKELDSKVSEKIMQDVLGGDSAWVNYVWLTYKLDLNTENDRAYLAITGVKNSEDKYDLKENFGAKQIENEYVYEDEDVSGTYTNNFYKYSDVNKEYKKLFGNKEMLPKKDFSAFANIYHYSKKVDAFAQVLLIWGDGGYDIIGGISNAYELDNKVYIEVAYGVADMINGDEYILTLTDKTEVILSEKDLKDKNLYKKYANKLNKKVYTFFKEDGIYKLESVQEN